MMNRELEEIARPLAGMFGCAGSDVRIRLISRSAAGVTATRSAAVVPGHGRIKDRE